MAKAQPDDQVREALASLRNHSNRATLDGMARYAIPSEHALGVAMKDIKALGKQLGHNQELAAALWETGVYEARMLASFVGDPARITAAQMDKWCRDFDNWAFCDAMCFNLFDRSPHAWVKVSQWSGSKHEFVKRTAFALLWSLSVHDKGAPDELFEPGLALIEKASNDDRNFVKKAVNMALRAIGKRNRPLNAAPSRFAQRDSTLDRQGRGKGAHQSVGGQATGPREVARPEASTEDSNEFCVAGMDDNQNPAFCRRTERNVVEDSGGYREADAMPLKICYCFQTVLAGPCGQEWLGQRLHDWAL